MAEAAPRLALRGVGKAFGGVQALAAADLQLHAGEVHALMGQNGAGKSTLIQVLTGVHAADSGSMLLDGRAIAPASPRAAQALGIATVYQEVNLCPNLSVAENIVAGRLPRRWGTVDWRAVRARARTSLDRLRLDIDPGRLLGELPVALQQMVAIARAISLSGLGGLEARVLILDEPTSSLDEAETARLFDAMRRLQDDGVAILFVTHFLDQAYAMADRITVLRNGRVVGAHRTEALPKLELVRLMVGRDVGPGTAVRPPAGDAAAAPVLQVRGLGRRGSVEPLDLDIAAGSVLGLAGLLGSGRTETARLLFGADRADSGTLRFGGNGQGGRAQRPPLQSPREALRAGLAFCPEERKTDGIVAELSLRENIVLALQARRGIWRQLPPRAQRVLADRYIEALGIRTASAETPIALLSGGNQQKAMLARWLATEPRLLILDEPTRGIDVAAKQEIMDRVLELCAGGMAIVFISSELPEVLRVSHRVAVLRERRKVAELAAAALDETALLHVIAGHDVERAAA